MPGSEQAAVVASTAEQSRDRLESLTAYTPWRGSLGWHETAAGSTIAAFGHAEHGSKGQWVAVTHGSVTNDVDAASILQTDSSDGPTLVAAALGSEPPRPSVLKGAFTGVALNRQTGDIRAVRSFGGGRPLAWSQGVKGIAIATEPAMAAALGSGGVWPDRQTLDRYASLDRVPTNTTFIQNSAWMLPGSWMSTKTGQGFVSLLDVSVPVLDRPREVAIKAVRSSIATAVERATQGAGSLGSMATGGLDSSSLVGFAAQQRPVDLAVTVRVKKAAQSAAEADLAKTAVGPLTARHHIIDLDPSDLVEGVAEWLPIIGPPSLLVVGLLTAGYTVAAEEGVDTLLDGIGGDHVFSFNPVRDAVAESRWSRLPPAVARAPRHGLATAARTAGRRLLSNQRHNHLLPRRYREWSLHTDATIRTRIAAHLGLRIEFPYLDHDVMATAAGVPAALRLPKRQLQREAVAPVLVHAHQPIKALYGDALGLVFNDPDQNPLQAACHYFADRWTSTLAAANGR